MGLSTVWPGYERYGINMKTLNKIAKAASKTLEILHWLGIVFVVLLLVCSLAAREWLASVLSVGLHQMGTTLTTYGFEMTGVKLDGSIDFTSITLFLIGAVLIFTMMAMVFRNIYLIFKLAEKNSPFQKDITRMIREIGIFYIAVPVIGLTMSSIARLFLGAEAAEISVNVEGFVTGILLLCLSQYFAYGTQLQNDVDGLL